MKQDFLVGLFGSKLRAKLIGWLFFHHDERFFVRQLQTILKLDPANLSRELARLAEFGLLVSTKMGNQKYYQANAQCPFFPELRGLATKTQGMAHILKEALEPVSSKIDFAFVFGSVAAGSDTASSDVDLMVVGHCDEMVLNKRISEAEQRLGRTINYSLFSREEFETRRKKKGEFVARILSSPKIMILGNVS